MRVAKIIDRYFTFFILAILLLLLLAFTRANADDYAETIDVFEDAGESAEFFNNSVGDAFFLTIGEGGIAVENIRFRELSGKSEEAS